MTTIRFGRLIVLACMGLAVACTSGTDGGTSGNTEINLDIVNPGGTSGELGFSIDRVDYRITCAGNPPGSYTIPPGDTIGTDYVYDDSVDISGAFEVIDTRTPPVWQAVMDLPPGDCTITLSVWDGDEVVCIGSQTLPILEDGTTKYDIVLVCSLSIDTPDGVANVDGTFEFITGNLCPKIYTLNAIPSTIPLTAIPPDTEVQYRAKDPDNTCGSNCDPQSCTFDNPPICTPAPYNPNDPACNPAAGGDPNSAACQDGVSHVGLVCTIAAIETTGGTPAGTFISPQDETTPVGPILPVNLNTAAGLPGIILPGLGGPASSPTVPPGNCSITTGQVCSSDADCPATEICLFTTPNPSFPNPSQPSGGGTGDNPLYPALPNVNGSLPPLVYLCDPAFPGAVLINLTCSDGDEECDKNKQLVITCPGTNYCEPPFSDPLTVCDSTLGECASDGACQPTCNVDCAIDQPTYDGLLCCGVAGGPGSCPADDCTQCPGRDVPLPAGTACTEGGGQVCDGAGACVECIVDADCAVLPAPVIPGTCQEPNTCVANTCVAGGASPPGTTCANGVCDGSGPPFGTGDPPCVFQVQPQSCSQVITVGCTNNVTADISILPYQLDATTAGVLDNNPVTADLGGIAEFSEAFLDAAQGAVPGGVTSASLVDLIASVQVRSGSTGAPITPIGAGSGIPYTCIFSGGPCNPLNNQPSVPGLQPNTDCVPTGTFNPCGRVVIIPTSADCAPGGTCDLIGKSAQCAANGFCVTGGLPIPLDPVIGASLGTADPSGNILFGWFDNPADSSAAVGTPPIDGDGTYNMVQISYSGVAGPVGLAVNAGGLAVQLECVMAEDSGGVDGVGVPDDASPTPDANLCDFFIQIQP